jgi:hypothetical protein
MCMAPVVTTTDSLIGSTKGDLQVAFFMLVFLNKTIRSSIFLNCPTINGQTWYDCANLIAS